MSIVTLSDAQQLRVYGLFTLSKFLHWSVVVENKLLFRWLVGSVRLTPTQLHELQPDVSEWVAAGLVNMGDCCNMSMWPLNPLTHLCVHLDKCIGLKPPVLKSYGVTFLQMQNAGLSPPFMRIFHFPLSDWWLLGLRPADMSGMTPQDTQRLFSKSMTECLHELAALERQEQ